MANPEHVEILKSGTEALRSRRDAHPHERLDLTQADLRGVGLESALLEDADFRGAILCGANLRRARLERAVLIEADLSNAFLAEAQLHGARCGGTVWSGRELAAAHGLDELVHLGPDVIDVDTLLWSAGEWPLAFLRGCGLPERFIELLIEPDSVSPEFVSPELAAGFRQRLARCHVCFAAEDAPFAERLLRALQDRGVRCWPAALPPFDGGSQGEDETRGLATVPPPSSILYPPPSSRLSTDALLVCASESCLNHPQLAAEVASALAREIPPHRAGRCESRLNALDLDGSLKAGDRAGLCESRLADRVVADFTGCAGDDKRFADGVGQIVSSLTIERQTEPDSASPDSQSPAHRIPPVASGTFVQTRKQEPGPAARLSLEEFQSLPGQTAGIVSGFRRLLRNDGGNSVWFDYRGEKAPTHHLRQLSADNLLEWETARVPASEPDSASLVCFVWAGSCGAFDEPQADGFALLLNGHELLAFDLSPGAGLWRNDAGTAALLFQPRWSSALDAAGFFYLGVAPELVVPGKTCRIAVRTLGVDSERWVGVNPVSDPVERQARADEG